MAKANDFRDKTIEELSIQYQELSKELFLMRNEMSVNRKLQQPHLIRQKKKDRARVMTVLREKESVIRG